MIPCASIMFPSFWPVLSNVSSVCHLLIYLVGLFVGMVLISKMMEYLLQNHKMKVSFAFLVFCSDVSCRHYGRCALFSYLGFSF